MSRYGKRVIKEGDNTQEQWYADAKEQTLETLPKFLKHLAKDYIHDYNTICHALAAGAVATTWALNHTDAGGITGFQAGAVMREYMQHFNNVKYPARLLQFEDMLYPQYARKFDKVIDVETWSWLRDQANSKLKNEKGDVHTDIKKHWLAIRVGHVPFGYRVGEERKEDK